MTSTVKAVAEIIEDTCSQVRVPESDYDRPLKDLGVDSLDIAGIFLAIQERLGVRVPDDDIDGLNTARLIAAYLDRQK